MPLLPKTCEQRKNASHLRKRSPARDTQLCDHPQYFKPEQADDPSNQACGQFQRGEGSEPEQVAYNWNVEHETQEEESTTYDPP